MKTSPANRNHTDRNIAPALQERVPAKGTSTVAGLWPEERAKQQNTESTRARGGEIWVTSRGSPGGMAN